MSCRIALITPEQLLEWVDASLVIDANKMVRSIIVAQDRYIKPILCKDLYDELLSRVENDTISGDFALLLDAIEPTLSFRVYARYLNSANIDSTEKGLRTWVEDNSQLVSDKRLAEMIKQADQDALTYEKDLMNFLKKNKDCFAPYYENCNCNNGGDSSQFKITSVGIKRRKPRLQYINTVLDSEPLKETSYSAERDDYNKPYER